MNWPPAHIKPLRNPAGDEIWDRIRQATMDLAIERGYYEFDVEDIVERAGVSRAEFDARFSGRTEACDRTYEANNAGFDSTTSRSTGRKVVVLWSLEISRMVCRKRNCSAIGSLLIIAAACTNFSAA